MTSAQQASPPARRPRFALVDLVRGLAILAMVGYHFAWDLYYLGFTATDVMTEPGWIAFQRGILSSFLLLVGAALVLGHGRGIRWRPFWRRFAVLLVAAALVSAGTYAVFPDYFVFFGVLHAIAAFSLVALPFLLAPLWLVLAGAALFLLAPAVVILPQFTDRWLAWIGFWPVPPPTTDIVPFFPWFGVVLLGLAGMRMLLAAPWRPVLEAWRPGRWSGWLAVAGRWSLVIYLLHQPLLYGGLSLLAQWQSATVATPIPGTVQGFVRSCEASCGAAGSSPATCSRYCACALEQVETGDLWATIDGARGAEARDAALGSITRLCEAMAE